MKRIEILENKTLFRNPRPGHQVINGYLPFVVALSERELICVYRQGLAFYSNDGVLAVLRSTDGGGTWQQEGPLWDPKNDDQPYAYSAPFLARLRDGKLVLAAFRAVFSKERLMVNPDTGGFLPVETVFFRSSDGGRNWSAPEPLNLPSGVLADLSGPVVELNDGTWFLPFDIAKPYDDPNPVKPKMAGFFSRDEGKTWGDMVTFADGAPQQKGHWHGRVVRLDDGRLFTMVWTQDGNTGRFIDLHRTVSDVNGRSWDTPQPTGIPGQTNFAVDLGNGKMFAVYTAREVAPPGIRGVMSDDGGQTWDVENSIVLWDATGRETIGVAARNVYPQSHDVIAFGRPQASRSMDGHVLVSFWCTEACLTQVQFCRICVH